MHSIQSIQSILNDARLIEETTSDPNTQSLATLVQQLAIRLQDAEALVATNEMKLRQLNSDSEMTNVGPACV